MSCTFVPLQEPWQGLANPLLYNLNYNWQKETPNKYSHSLNSIRFTFTNLQIGKIYAKGSGFWIAKGGWISPYFRFYCIKKISLDTKKRGYFCNQNWKKKIKRSPKCETVLNIVSKKLCPRNQASLVQISEKSNTRTNHLLQLNQVLRFIPTSYTEQTSLFGNWSITRRHSNQLLD